MMADLRTHTWQAANCLRRALPMPPVPPSPDAADAADATHATDAPDAGNVADLASLRATARGDRDAFAVLYRRQHARLARFLRRFTTRQELIDEVVNDALWVVWRKAGDFRGDSRVSTWITGIAYRCMLKALHQGAPKEELGEALLDPQQLAQAAAASVDHAPAAEQQNWVAHGLLGLPDEQRITLELAYFMGCSCEEIAQVMGCPVGTVKARMFHARVRLRSVLPALATPGQAAQG